MRAKVAALERAMAEHGKQASVGMGMVRGVDGAMRSIVDAMMRMEDTLRRHDAGMEALEGRQPAGFEEFKADMTSKMAWLISGVQMQVCTQYNSAISQWQHLTKGSPVPAPVIVCNPAPATP